MTEAALWWVHTVTVEPYLGSGAYGDVYDTPQDRPGWVEDGAHLVTNNQGQQVTSTAVAFGPLADASLFPPLSRVTVNGRESHVITLLRRDSGSLDMEIDHYEAHLT